MNRIVRVYGTCDNWQVEFQNEGGSGIWTCAVPADLTDGQYACRFYAIDDDGEWEVMADARVLGGDHRVDESEIEALQEIMLDAMDTEEDDGNEEGGTE